MGASGDVLVPLCLVVLVMCVACGGWLRRRRRRRRQSGDGAVVVGFLHPRCDGGGGGERVLWQAVAAMSEDGRNKVVVFSAWDVTLPKVRILVERGFGLSVPGGVEVVPLRSGDWTEPRRFPLCTLLFQSLAGCVVAAEALFRRDVDVFVETSAHAFAPAVAKAMGAKVATYVHYPTISSEMLQNVAERRTAVNNSRRISSSPLASRAKVLYYQMFAAAYGLCLRRADVVMANSTWTENHLVALLGDGRLRVLVVFPPCGSAEDMSTRPAAKTPGMIVSLAQFRPEKNHEVQLQMLQQLRHKFKLDAELHLVGGARTGADIRRVQRLKNLAVSLGVAEHCKFHVNVPRSELDALSSRAPLAVHTMHDEHFGISIVELMAKGAIVIGHNSGGVQADIIRHGVNGFLADNYESYAVCARMAMNMSPEQLRQMLQKARADAQRFSDQRFRSRFLEAVRPLVTS